MDKCCGVVCVPTRRSSCSTLKTIFYLLLFLLVAVAALFITAYVACEDDEPIGETEERDDFLNIPVCSLIRNAVVTTKDLFSEKVAEKEASFMEAVRLF